MVLIPELSGRLFRAYFGETKLCPPRPEGSLLRYKALECDNG